MDRRTTPGFCPEQDLHNLTPPTSESFRNHSNPRPVLLPVKSYGAARPLEAGLLVVPAHHDLAGAVAVASEHVAELEGGVAATAAACALAPAAAHPKKTP